MPVSTRVATVVFYFHFFVGVGVFFFCKSASPCPRGGCPLCSCFLCVLVHVCVYLGVSSCVFISEVVFSLYLGRSVSVGLSSV